MRKKYLAFVAVALTILVGGILLLVGKTNNPITSNTGTLGRSGADIEIITGAGGMPPTTSQGELLTGEQFTVVFTEPFSSLDNWQASKEIASVSTTSGKASIDLSPGKYGVYYIYQGEKILYGGLTLENPRNDIQRNKQGPWYIQVHNLLRTKLNFSINSQPS